MKRVTNYSKPDRKKMRLKDASKEASTKVVSVKQKRVCLKCGEKFPSKGPFNRVCDKCSSTNERVANSRYAVRESSSPESSAAEKRFYGFN